MNQLIAIIQNAVEKITKTVNEPLDGDATEKLGRLFTIELDLSQGNISENEYRNLIRKQRIR